MNPQVEANKKLHDIDRKAVNKELAELRKQVKKNKAIQKKQLEINAFLKTLKLTEFENLKLDYTYGHPMCLPEFHNPNNWIDRICVSEAHLDNWLTHVEDYQETTSS